MLFSTTILQPKCTSEAIISCNVNSGYNGDRKNVSVINDNLKSSASKALCLQVFSHAAMSVRLMCFSCFHMPQCRFGKGGALLLASRAEFQDHRGRASGWGISRSRSSGALQIPAILHAFPSGSGCWQKATDTFIPRNALAQKSSDFKPHSCPSRTGRQQNYVFVNMILLLNPCPTEL